MTMSWYGERFEELRIFAPIALEDLHRDPVPAMIVRDQGFIARLRCCGWLVQWQ